MNKKTYIQNASMHMLPDLMAKKVKPEQVIRACERMWALLSEAGYGEVNQQPIKPKQGFYQAMEETARVGFDKFWQAFGHKQSRDQAAKAWLQIGDIDDDLLALIVSAAKLAKADWDVLPNREGKTRVYPATWLNERRWEDLQDRVKTAHVGSQQESNRVRLSILASDIKALADQGGNKPDSPLYEQFTRLCAERADLKAGNKKAP